MDNNFYNNFYNNMIEQGFLEFNILEERILVKPDSPIFYVVLLNQEFDNEVFDFEYYINKYSFFSKKIRDSDIFNNFFCNNIIVLNILLSDKINEERKNILDNIEFYPEKKDYDIFWIYDINKRNFFCGKNYPNKISNIRDILVYSIDNNNIKRESVNLKKNHNVKFTFFLIFLNIILFLFMSIFDYRNDFINYFGNKSYYISQNFELYRFFTSIFIHNDIIHLMENMLSLYIFGTIIEKIYGTFKISLVYFLSGIFGSFLSFIFNKGISVGASGAIFGIIACVLYMTKKNKTIMYDIGINYYTMIVLSIVNISSGFIIDKIDNFAHIGGFLCGIFLSILICNHK